MMMGYGKRDGVIKNAQAKAGKWKAEKIQKNPYCKKSKAGFQKK